MRSVVGRAGQPVGRWVDQGPGHGTAATAELGHHLAGIAAGIGPHLYLASWAAAAGLLAFGLWPAAKVEAASARADGKVPQPAE